MNRPDLESLQCCSCCGLVQRVPPAPSGLKVCCARCASALRIVGRRTASHRLTLALCLSAVVLYPLAIGLPMLRVEKLGHRGESSVLEGTVELLASGQYWVGVVVFLCSIVFPIGKLFSLLLLCSAGRNLSHRHRALTYHCVEWTGRWGMLDVLLVAILVTTLKLRDVVDVSAGPAAFAFAACVVLSLLASASFDPHLLWQPIERARHAGPEAS